MGQKTFSFSKLCGLHPEMLLSTDMNFHMVLACIQVWVVFMPQGRRLMECIKLKDFIVENKA